MRKGLIYPLLSMAVAASLLAGCTGGQQSKDYMEENDSVTVYPPDTAFYGHLGEGTGMSSLELITDDGDTLALNKTNEKTGEPGRILGEIANYTDQYAITTCDDNQSVNVALNINQLAQRKWQSDTDKQHGFQLALTVYVITDPIVLVQPMESVQLQINSVTGKRRRTRSGNEKRHTGYFETDTRLLSAAKQSQEYSREVPSHIIKEYYGWQ